MLALAMAPPDEYYSPRVKPRRTQQLNVRVTRDLRTALDQLADFWTRLDRAQDPDAEEWTVGDVVHRLCEVGISGAWERFGGRPLDRAKFDAVLNDAIGRLRKLDTEG